MGNSITSIGIKFAFIEGLGGRVILTLEESDGVEHNFAIRPAFASWIAENLQLAVNPPDGSVVNVGLTIEEGGAVVY